MKKRTLAILLCLCLVLSLFPATAFAAGESGIQLGAGGIGTDDTIYFGTYGTYQVPWYVLGSAAWSGTSVATGTNVLPLLSKYTLGTSQFRVNSDWGYYNCNDSDSVSESVLKATMDGLYNGTGTKLFSDLEQGVIVETYLKEESIDSSLGDISARLFPLSYNEALVPTLGSDILKAKSITDTAVETTWWLRGVSAGVDVTCIIADGTEERRNVGQFEGVRPALNLGTANILFTSVAEGGKTSGTVGAGALNANLTPTGVTEWKLTLLDSANHSTFSVSTSAVSTTTVGGSVSVSYSGATTGTNEYLSAMLVNSSDAVLYYGRLNQLMAGEASGTQNITIPALTVGTYTLKIFNEQYNGDKNTDYSSELKDVTLNVRPTVVASLTSGSASFTTGAASSDAVFTLSADYAGFDATTNYDHVTFNGATLTDSQVTAADGSIVLTFSKAYLNTLSAGTHTATVHLKGDLYAETTVPITFTVTAPATQGRANPSTGVSSNSSWLAFATLSAIGAAVLLNFCCPKREEKKHN